jgi:hypothetical protein
MNIINIVLGVDTQPCSSITLGRRGENEVTQVVVDFSSWVEEFGAGVITLLAMRSQDTSAYPVVLTLDGNTATWDVTSTDTAYKGSGRAEYIYTVGEQIAKSVVFNTVVMQDIGEPSETPPDPYEDWLERLTELGAETQANAEAAQQSAENAAESAEDAVQSAASADGYAGQAETAAGFAQAAQTASEAARDAAQTAQASAESSATAASGSAASAASSATAAAGSASEASASASAAGASATAAGNAATQAEAAKTAAQAAQSAAEDAAEDAQQAAQQAHVEYEQLSGEVDDLSDEVAQQKSAIETIAEIVTDTVELSENTQSAIREQGDTSYKNIWFPQTFVAGTEYTVKIDFDVADISSFYCGTTHGNTTSAGFVDGGNLAGTQWKQGAQVTGDSHTIKFVASAAASYFRIRLIFNSYDFENTIRVTVSTEVTIDERLSQVSKNVQTLMHTPTESALAGIAEALTHNANGAYLNFAFLTDTHADQFDALDAFVAVDIIGHANIVDGIFHGGDFAGRTYDSLADYVDAITHIRSEQFVGKMIVAKGNHENYGPTANNAQFVSMFQRSARLVVNPDDPSGGYGLMDYDRYKVRVVILNTWAGVSGTVENVGETQLLWLRNTALSVPDGWTIVVIAHNINDTADSTVDTNVLLPLRQILGAFANPGTQYGEYVFPVGTPGLLAGVIVGHKHSDDYNGNSGYNKIVVRRAGADNGDGFAVDVFTVDTSAHILYETRIGLGDSRAFRYGDSHGQIS